MLLRNCQMNGEPLFLYYPCMNNLHLLDYKVFIAHIYLADAFPVLFQRAACTYHLQLNIRMQFLT
jgi:hypothetical protein